MPIFRAGCQGMETRVSVHIYPSTFEHESRILRVTGSLCELGLFSHVVIVARWRPGLAEHERIDEEREVYRIRAVWSDRVGWKKAFSLLHWFISVIWLLRKRRLDCINCHSLTVLPVSVALKVLHRARLVYEPHELETERRGLTGLTKYLSKLAERTLIGLADAVVVVGEAIAGWYRSTYGLPTVHVIYNLPEVGHKFSKITRKVNSQKKGLTFGYLGVLSEGRGVELMLQVFARQDTHHLRLVGDGPLAETVRGYADKHDHIEYIGFVFPEKIPHVLRDVDIGVCLIENLCLSYYYSIPNKLFECLGNGIPVVISDFPEMARIIDRYHVGWKVKPKPEALQSLLAALDPADIERKTRAAVSAADMFQWSREKHKLASIYTAFGFQPIVDICSDHEPTSGTTGDKANQGKPAGT